MTKTQSLIRAVYQSLPDCDAGWGRNYVDNLRDQCERAERQHRSGRPAGVSAPRAFSVADAGRYFAAHYLYEMATGKVQTPALSQMLHVRSEYMYAAAMVSDDAIGPKLRQWALTVPAAFAALDYCELVK